MRNLIILTAGLGLIAVPAFAHAFLDEATPRVGATVNTAPKEIRISYTEEVEPAFSHIVLLDAGGKPVATGAVTVDARNHKQLIAPITGPLAPGHYKVRWDVISVDTHHTDGHFTFDYQP